MTRAFRLEQFRDYLALEAGNSPHTVENYLRDVRRLAEYGESKGVRGPADVTAAQLREFIYFLKDLGLAATTIRRQVSALQSFLWRYHSSVFLHRTILRRPFLVIYSKKVQNYH